MNGTDFPARLTIAEVRRLDEWLQLDDLAGERPVLPPWAERVAGLCSWYQFTTQWVKTGRAVVARRVVDGTGPAMVITSDESEMLAALGLATH